jgi:hypothetical protein
MMKPVLAFDIETLPDVEGLRRLHGLDATLSDDEVAELAFQQRRASQRQRLPAAAPAARGGDFLRAARRQGFPRLVAGRARAGRGEIIQRFFDGIEKVHAADRVLERRRLRPAGAALSRPDARRGAPRYWDLGDGDYPTAATSSGTTTSAATHAPPGPDGPAGDVPAARQRAARRARQADRLSRQARHGRRQGVGRWQAGGSPRSATTARPTSSTPTSSRSAFA